MAATVPEVTQFLDELDLTYNVTERDDIVLTFTTETYHDMDGEPRLLLVIRLEEEGEYFKLFAPEAFAVTDGVHLDAFLRACAIVQWRTKLIQFEFDERDGEIRPIVEFPLEDAPLTQSQVRRCIVGMVQLLEEFYPTLDRALSHGEVDFEPSENMLAGVLSELLAQVPPDVLAEALRLADERRRDEGEL